VLAGVLLLCWLWLAAVLWKACVLAGWLGLLSWLAAWVAGWRVSRQLAGGE